MATEEALLREMMADYKDQQESAAMPKQKARKTFTPPGQSFTPEGDAIKRAKVRKDGGVTKQPIEDIPFGTFTSLGMMAGPYGAAAGLVADVGAEAYRANRGTQRRNKINKEVAEVTALQMQDKAARTRNDLEQNALANLMGVGQG